MRVGDLNLLLHFDALMSWRSVSRAAEELQITQPAMSAALSRLRRLFNDPILVRVGSGWQPTPDALELHAQYRPLLDLWRRTSLPLGEFDPKTSQRTISMFATDYIQFILLGQVVGELKKEAPGININVKTAQPQLGLQMLESNQVELIAGYFPEPSANLRSRFLFEENAVCLVRQNHPLFDNDWNLEAFLRYEHVSLSAHTRYFGERLDHTLSAINKSRKIGVTLSSYLACPEIVSHSDLIAVIPNSIASRFIKYSPTVILETPISLPKLTISLYWHERHQRDPAHAWFRQFVATQIMR